MNHQPPPTIKHLLIPKQFGTYADTFLTLGLALLTDYTLNQTHQATPLQLIDEGTGYRIQFHQPIHLEPIATLPYANPFPPICDRNTDRSQLPPETPIFDVVKAREIRKRYREFFYQNHNQLETGEDTPQPPHPSTQNAVILTAMRHDRNHNQLWQKGWEQRHDYGILITCILQAFSQDNHAPVTPPSQQVADLFLSTTGHKLPQQASAVKLYFPTAVQGVNRVKADSNKFDSQKLDWLSLWLIANGLFTCGISERVKVAERTYDWRVTALTPKDISLTKYRDVLNHLRQYNPPGGGHGIARFDAELVLRFCQSLLNYHQAQADSVAADEFDIWQSVNYFVAGFTGTHFGQKGKVYGVKELFNLGLPGWIHPQNTQELLDYSTVLNEHLAVIRSLSAEEGHSERLALYRDFITGNNLRQFFPFQVSYADYITKQLAEPHAKPPRLFSTTGLNLMIQQEQSFTQITQNASFLRIAKAINQSTVFAGKIQTKNGLIELDWQRHYGLAQQLSSQSGSKKDFICAITDFLSKYEHENLRLTERYQGTEKHLMRVWTTKEDLDRLIELVEAFDTVLVANLLIAYGYAKWTKSEEGEG